MQLLPIHLVANLESLLPTELT